MQSNIIRETSDPVTLGPKQPFRSYRAPAVAAEIAQLCGEACFTPTGDDEESSDEH